MRPKSPFTSLAAGTALILVALVLIIPAAIALLTGPKAHAPERPIADPNQGITVESPAEEPTIQVYNAEEGQIVPMKLEEYVVGAVAAEMPASYDLEALKAQAVAARTLAAYKWRGRGGPGCANHPGADICTAYTHCQAWVDETGMREKWGTGYEKWRQKVTEAVAATRGMILTYDGQPIQVFYYATSNGKTEDSAAVFAQDLPYYGVVDSPGEEGYHKYDETVTFTRAEVADTLCRLYPASHVNKKDLEKQIEILSHTDSGRVAQIRIGDITISGSAFRQAFGLNSTDFTITYKGNNVHIRTLGYGHGVGMSQVGAQAMAEKGADVSEILAHYYIGTTLYRMYE
jgi:stage II sporulation protein D